MFVVWAGYRKKVEEMHDSGWKEEMKQGFLRNFSFKGQLTSSMFHQINDELVNFFKS